MVRNVLRLVLVVNSVSKALNRVKKIPIFFVMNYNPRFYYSHEFLVRKCVWSSDSN